MCLLYQLAAVIVAVALINTKSGRLSGFFLALIYTLIGIPGAWMIWWLPCPFPLPTPTHLQRTCSTVHRLRSPQQPCICDGAQQHCLQALECGVMASQSAQIRGGMGVWQVHSPLHGSHQGPGVHVRLVSHGAFFAA